MASRENVPCCGYLVVFLFLCPALLHTYLKHHVSHDLVVFARFIVSDKDGEVVSLNYDSLRMAILRTRQPFGHFLTQVQRCVSDLDCTSPSLCERQSMPTNLHNVGFRNGTCIGGDIESNQPSPWRTHHKELVECLSTRRLVLLGDSTTKAIWQKMVEWFSHPAQDHRLPLNLTTEWNHSLVNVSRVYQNHSFAVIGHYFPLLRDFHGFDSRPFKTDVLNAIQSAWLTQATPKSSPLVRHLAGWRLLADLAARIDRLGQPPGPNRSWGPNCSEFESFCWRDRHVPVPWDRRVSMQISPYPAGAPELQVHVVSMALSRGKEETLLRNLI